MRLSAAIYLRCCLESLTFPTFYKYPNFVTLLATIVNILSCNLALNHYFTIGWISPLPLEKEAARLVFDEEYPQDEV
jgi:hypothetical protein